MNRQRHPYGKSKILLEGLFTECRQFRCNGMYISERTDTSKYHFELMWNLVDKPLPDHTPSIQRPFQINCSDYVIVFRSLSSELPTLDRIRSFKGIILCDHYLPSIEQCGGAVEDLIHHINKNEHRRRKANG